LFVVVDGKKISNVDQLSVYWPNDAVDEAHHSDHDDYVLRKLLKKSGWLTTSTVNILGSFLM